MPPLLVFLKFIFTAMEKDTGTKIGDFLKNFMGNVLIYIFRCVSWQAVAMITRSSLHNHS